MKLGIVMLIGLIIGMQAMFMLRTHDATTVHKSIGHTTHTHYSKMFTGKETCIEFYDSERFLGSYLPVYVCEAR